MDTKNGIKYDGVAEGRQATIRLNALINSINNERENIRVDKARQQEHKDFVKYVNSDKHIQILGLKRFIQTYENLSEAIIIEMLQANKSKFKFLNKLISLVPDSIEELRRGNVDNVEAFYCHEVARRRNSMRLKVNNLIGLK